MKIGQRVIWIPNEVDGWGYDDEWSNPFANLVNRALTSDEMEVYTDWSENVKQGTVVRSDNEFFVIKLLPHEPTVVAGLDECQYPLGIDMGEYWARVQESPDFVPFTVCPQCNAEELTVDDDGAYCDRCHWNCGTDHEREDQ